MVHTHPATPGETAICGDPNAFPPVAIKTLVYKGGMSEEDYNGFVNPYTLTIPPMTNLYRYVPRIIIDKKNVYAYRKRALGPSDVPVATTWSNGHCRWRS
jgi:hypothetical protein